MTVDLEERLRRTLEVVMPLLEPDDTGATPTVTARVGSSSGPARPRGLLVAACLVLAIVAAGALVVAARSRDAAVPADTPAPSVLSSVPAGPDSPVWYRMIVPVLPANFSHVALTGAGSIPGGSRWIGYTAIDPVSDESLNIRVEATAGATQTAPSGTEPLGTVSEDADRSSLVTASGLIVIVECGIGKLSSGLLVPGGDCTTFDRNARRAFMVQLASSFPINQIESVALDPRIQYTELDPVRAAMSAALPGQQPLGQDDGTTVVFGSADLSAGTAVTVLRDVYPPSDDNRAIEMHTYGASSVDWTISNGIAIRLFSSQTTVPTRTLAALLAEIQQIVQNSPASSTSRAPNELPTTTLSDETLPSPPGSPSISSPANAATVYVAPGEATATWIATLFCLQVDELAAFNQWPDGENHVTASQEHVRIPEDACFPS